MGFKRKFDPNPPPKEFVGKSVTCGNEGEITEETLMLNTMLKTFRDAKYF